MVRAIVTLVVVLLLLPACVYIAPVRKAETGESNLVDCDGSLYDQTVALSQSGNDPCVWVGALTEEFAGTGDILTVTAPNASSGQPFWVEVGGEGTCLDDDEITDHWEGEPVANTYLVDFSTAECPGDQCNTLDVLEFGEEVLHVAFCDEAGDYAADPAAAPPPPWLPLSGPFGYAHVSQPHAGRYSFAIMERQNSRVCAALTRRKAPTSQTAFAYLLADESSVEGVLRYDPVAVTGLPALPSGSYATLTQVGTTWLVTATTGSSQGDAALGLPGQALFEPIEGPSPFPLVARRTAATVCARLFAAHP